MLFKKKPGNRLLSIQINDQKIDNDISKLILDCEKAVRSLQESLRKEDLVAKDILDEELLSRFMKMTQDTDILIHDVYKIRAIELQEKGYIRINDEKYLLDKLKQLTVLKQSLNTLTDLLQERPSGKDLEQELIKDLCNELSHIIGSMDKIKEDDSFLKKQYEQLMSLF